MVQTPNDSLMLRLTWVLLTEAIVLTVLTTLLFVYPTDANVTRSVACVLAAFATLVTVMMLGQRTLLQPFASTVGLCQLCGG